MGLQKEYEQSCGLLDQKLVKLAELKKKPEKYGDKISALEQEIESLAGTKADQGAALLVRLAEVEDAKQAQLVGKLGQLNRAQRQYCHKALEYMDSMQGYI